MGKIAKTFDVSGCTNIDQVLQLSGTDWDIQSHRAAGSLWTDGGFRALVRPDTGTALAFVGERFRPNSHRAQLHTLDRLVEDWTISPVSVSVWDNGAIMAYQFRCPGLDVTVHDRDIVSPLLTLAFSYGFTLADLAFFADFRWHCKNQLGKVAKLATDRVKHRGDIHLNYGDALARRMSELIGELGDHYASMRRMVGKPLGGKALVEYFGESVGATKEDVERAWVSEPKDLTGAAARIPEIVECYQSDDCGAPGSVWQAYNAVTRYETHKVGRTVESRTRRMLLGSGNEVASNAFEVASRIAA
jgi:hypothetical protein